MVPRTSPGSPTLVQDGLYHPALCNAAYTEAGAKVLGSSGAETDDRARAIGPNRDGRLTPVSRSHGRRTGASWQGRQVQQRPAAAKCSNPTRCSDQRAASRGRRHRVQALLQKLIEPARRLLSRALRHQRAGELCPARA